MEKQQNDYDVIIIGAGIGGLACGCYLAKAGLKTLIVEKNVNPGGYCASFEKNGFRFDACAHTIGKLIFTVLDELDLSKNLNLKRANPSNIIITSEYKVNFWNNLDETILEFQKFFPREANNINLFFDYIINCQGTKYYPLVHLTFKDLLERYFKDDKLKEIFSLLLLKNVGLPSSKISAFTAVTIYKDFVLSGGYYLEDGIQDLPNILTAKLRELGGDILFSTSVKKVKIKSNHVEGVLLANDNFISAKYIVSNIDVRQTFLNLIGKDLTNISIVDKLNSMTPSLSSFVIYIGCENKIDVPFPSYSTVFVSPNLEIEDSYMLAQRGEIEHLDWYMFFISSDRKSIVISLNIAYQKEEYWLVKKYELVDIFLKKIEQIIPDLSNSIIFKDAATPHTLYKRTSNYNGSAFGWESIPSQFAITGFCQTTPIGNLYLTGHWTTLTQGISGVAYLGRSTAKLVLDKEQAKQ